MNALLHSSVAHTFHETPLGCLQRGFSLLATLRFAGALHSGLVMDLLHQSLERAPADFAKVSIIVGHELLAAVGAV